MLAGRSVSRETSPQDQTMEGSTLPPPLLCFLCTDYDMVLYILLTYQVRKQNARVNEVTRSELLIIISLHSKWRLLCPLWCETCMYLVMPCCSFMQCLMLMEMLFDADGLSQHKMNVVKCAWLFQLHLIRLVKLSFTNGQRCS